jgi:hypothetical protein
MTKRDGAKDLHAYVASVLKNAPKRTGLVCPSCGQPVAQVEHQIGTHTRLRVDAWGA